VALALLSNWIGRRPGDCIASVVRLVENASGLQGAANPKGKWSFRCSKQTVSMAQPHRSSIFSVCQIAGASVLPLYGTRPYPTVSVAVAVPPSFLIMLPGTAALMLSVGHWELVAMMLEWTFASAWRRDSDMIHHPSSCSSGAACCLLQSQN
jgi:hypothetical protein